MKDKIVLLSFDVEEFNLPIEYGENIPEEKQFSIAFNGLKKILNLLKKRKNVKATFFVTASFAKKYPRLLKEISLEHEIASHGLHHFVTCYNEDEVKKSKKIIEKIIQKEINGFRIPRLGKVDFDSLEKLGFKYDSSICPTYLPGRYNNYFKKRKITKNKKLSLVPISTTPIVRLPLYWIFFRNFGLTYSKNATNLCMRNPGFTNLFFHPWEFNDLGGFKIPFYIRKNSGDKALVMLEEYLRWCEGRNYKFLTFTDYLESFKD